METKSIAAAGVAQSERKNQEMKLMSGQFKKRL